MYKKIILIIFPIFILTCVITSYITQYSKKSFNTLIANDTAGITKASMHNGSNGNYVKTNDKNKIKDLINLLNNRYYNKSFNQSPRSGYSYYYDFYSGDKQLIRITGSGSNVNINGDYYDVSKEISDDSLTEWFNSLSSVNTASAGDEASSDLASKDGGGVKVYKNKEYNVSLKYNKDWKANNKYINRYEGKDGFFQISAYNGQNLEIDAVADNEANHKLKPYGSKPQISKLVVQGQEARLIMPSEDQPAEEDNAAEVVIKYPKEIKISGDKYFYLIVNADKSNINKIINTIKFIN